MADSLGWVGPAQARITLRIYDIDIPRYLLYARALTIYDIKVSNLTGNLKWMKHV